MDNLTKGSFDYPLSKNKVELPVLVRRQIALDVLRLDTIHPVISGNKWFKLKGWLRHARSTGARQILTFGGAWSNHIIATAYAARAAALPATGIIRGEQPRQLSATLQAAQDHGMQLEFISRETYRQKTDPFWLRQLATRYPDACIIPEGGAGQPGISGCEEILDTVDKTLYTHILCAIGTGTMYQGLLDTAAPDQGVLGISVLKGLHGSSTASPIPNNGSRIIPGYHFGGYARHTDPLLHFMNEFYRDTGIPTDFVYTGKLCFATLDMVKKHLFEPGSRLLVIHSGGLQGNQSLAPGALHF